MHPKATRNSPHHVSDPPFPLPLKVTAARLPQWWTPALTLALLRLVAEHGLDNWAEVGRRLAGEVAAAAAAEAVGEGVGVGVGEGVGGGAARIVPSCVQLQSALVVFESGYCEGECLHEFICVYHIHICIVYLYVFIIYIFVSYTDNDMY